MQKIASTDRSNKVIFRRNKALQTPKSYTDFQLCTAWQITAEQMMLEMVQDRIATGVTGVV
jgi:hypothetical protein